MNDDEQAEQATPVAAEWWASLGAATEPQPVQLVGRAQILRALNGIIELLEGDNEEAAYMLLKALRTVVQQDEALLQREDEQHTTH